MTEAREVYRLFRLGETIEEHDGMVLMRFTTEGLDPGGAVSASEYWVPREQV